jgi:hypothetical protein
MKFPVRALVLGICTVGASAALATSQLGSVPMVSSHQAVVAAMPIPSCSPGAKCGNNTGFIAAAMPIPSCSPGAKCGNNTGF